MKTAFISFVWTSLLCTGAADSVEVGPGGVECLGDECENTAINDEVALLQTFRKESRSMTVDNKLDESAMKASLLRSKEEEWQQMLKVFQTLEDAGVPLSKVEQNKMYKRILADPATDSVEVDPEFKLSALEEEENTRRADEMKDVLGEIVYCMKPEFDEVFNATSTSPTDAGAGVGSDLGDLFNIAQAEVFLRLEPNKSDPTYQSVVGLGKEAAKRYVLNKLEFLEHQDFEGTILGSTAIDKFALAVEQVGAACGLQDAEHLGLDVQGALHNSSDNSIDESPLAVNRTTNIAESSHTECLTENVDIDYFIGIERQGNTNCSKLYAEALGTHTAKGVKKKIALLEYYAKASLALHNERNPLGHHFVEALRYPSSKSSHKHDELMNKLLETAQAPLSPASLARLHYVEQKHYVQAHGKTREQICNDLGTVGKSDVWDGLHAYADCLCVQNKPFLVCDAVHEKDLAGVHQQYTKKAEAAFKVIHEASEEQAEEVSLTGANGTAVQETFGLCWPPISCELCQGGGSYTVKQCINTGPFGGSVDIFSLLNNKLTSTEGSGCLSGSCGLEMGTPRSVCALKLVIKLGISVGAAGGYCPRSSWGFLANLAITASMEICLGGKFADLGSLVGLSACKAIASMAYYPYVGKMTFSSVLPIWSPIPFFGHQFHLKYEKQVHNILESLLGQCRKLSSARAPTTSASCSVWSQYKHQFRNHMNHPFRGTTLGAYINTMINTFCFAGLSQQQTCFNDVNTHKVGGSGGTVGSGAGKIQYQWLIGVKIGFIEIGKWVTPPGAYFTF